MEDSGVGAQTFGHYIIKCCLGRRTPRTISCQPLCTSSTMENYYDVTDNSSFFVRDTAFSVASVASVAHRVPALCETANSTLYYILALAQSRSVDFLPIVPQSALGDLGMGLTAVVNQSFIDEGLALAFKEVGSGPAFLHELSFVSARALRLHPFITTLQGIGWDVDGDKVGDTWLIKPVLVFEKANKNSLWLFMQTEEGRGLSDTQRVSLCIQLTIALLDLQEYSKFPNWWQYCDVTRHRDHPWRC
jgi:hypothetical protein